MSFTLARRGSIGTPSGGSPPPATVTLLTHTIAPSTDGNKAVTSAIDTTGATLIVVAVASFTGGATVTDSAGNAWTGLSNTGAQGVKMFVCTSPTASGTHTFTATNNSGFPAAAVAAFSGTLASTTADVNDHSTASTSGSVQPGSATPAHDGELILTAMFYLGAGTAAVDSGLTIINQTPHAGNSVGGGLAYLVQSTAAAINPTWSGLGGGNSYASMASFQHG